MNTQLFSKPGTDKTLKLLKSINYLLRTGVAFTFTGHGMNAIAVKQNWIPLLTVYGFSVEQAKMIMPWIGVLDIIVALLVLIHPFRGVVIWAIFWTFATALTRWIAGEGVWEFIERGSNWAAPLALFLLSRIEVYHVKNQWVTIEKKAGKEKLVASLKGLLFFHTLP
ncbi:MAG TPA: hypothetical protein VLB84_02215 [Bacteroidia bacterium]|nr:hypothetical protein [Bacteroidia bacterium]